MSSKSEQLQAEYKRLAKSIAGRDLLNWINSTADSYRKRAADQDPEGAWKMLQIAEGLTEVHQRIVTKAKLDTKEVKKL